MQMEIRIIKKPMQQGVLMPVIFRSEQNKNKGETDWNIVTKLYLIGIASFKIKCSLIFHSFYCYL